MNHAQPSVKGTWLGSRWSNVLMMFLAIIGFLLFTEHRAHLLGILPYLLLLACPFIHFFMHGGHGEQSGVSGQHH